MGGDHMLGSGGEEGPAGAGSLQWDLRRAYSEIKRHGLHVKGAEVTILSFKRKERIW